MAKESHSPINNNETGGSRRKFLVNATAASTLFSVPGKSVWGACTVSGAMSGNVSGQNRNECVRPHLMGGRSPGGWRKINRNCHSVFKQSGKKGSDRVKCYIDVINQFIDHNHMTLDPRVYNGSLASGTSGQVNLRTALNSQGGGDGSLEFNLAAVFLNSFFGLYDFSFKDNEAKANQIVNSIIVYLVSEASNGNYNVDFDFNFGGVNKNTQYVISYCSHKSGN